MSTQDELNWDDVLGGVEAEEKENPDKPKSDFEALPKGPYEVVVQEAEKLTSGAGNDMIKVRVQVTGGPYANRVLFSYIVFTDNPKGNRVSLEKLAAFGITREVIATQRPSLPEIASLLEGRKAIAVVGIQADGQYKGSNEVKGFKPLEGVEQPAPQAAAKPKAAGVPNIPTPDAAPSATPNIPTPDVAVGYDPAEEPF